jgi:tetratricopeptide (TPR) repeat protein
VSDIASSPETRLADIRRLATTHPARALELALAARKQGLSDPLIHHLAGLSLKQSGHFDAAILEFGEGLKLDPDNVVLMTLVGFCLIELGRRPEAAQVFEQALKRDPRAVEANYGYGWAAEGLGALEQAQSAWERTVALAPNHADALAGLSGLAVRRRDWGVARDLAERAAAADPRQTDALMNLTRIDLGQMDYPAAETRLQELIVRPDLKPLARANAKIMLGDALDGQKRFKEAYGAYAEGKGDLRALHADIYERPGANSALDSVRKLLSAFEATPPEAWARSRRPSMRQPCASHVFLLGFPRSGTTLLEQVLATHPSIVTLEERPALLKAEVEFLASPNGMDRLAAVMSDSLEALREDYWRRVAEFGVNVKGKVFVDKQPLHTFRLPLIHKMFPDAKIIFAIRDPRDVVLSCFRRSFNMNASMYQFNTMMGAALYYDAVMESGATYRRALPLDLFAHRYEDLVRDFTGAGQKLCAFLGVDWTPDLEGFAKTAGERRIATPSSTQVGRGLYDGAVEQWRHYDFALEPVVPILRPWIDAFGYAAS